MKVVKYIYENQEIEFDIDKNHIMVNATEMAKIFGKRVDVFLKTDHAKRFIKALESTPFGVNSRLLKRDEIIQTRGQLGTFFHRVLALKFAAWLDVYFELWVFTTIDKIINLHGNEQKEALVEKLTAAQKKKIYKEKILSRFGDDEDIVRFFKEEENEKQADKKRRKSITDQTKQLKLEFKL